MNTDSEAIPALFKDASSDERVPGISEIVVELSTTMVSSPRHAFRVASIPSDHMSSQCWAVMKLWLLPATQNIARVRKLTRTCENEQTDTIKSTSVDHGQGMCMRVTVG